MNNLFRSSKSSSKSRQSVEPAPTELGSSSVPYERISSSGSLPVATSSNFGSLSRPARNSSASTSSASTTTRVIGAPSTNPNLTEKEKGAIPVGSSGEELTIHDYFARTAGDRAEVAGRLTRSPAEDDFGPGSSGGGGNRYQVGRTGSTGSRVAILRDGPSPTPSIANPSSAHRRKDSDHSTRSIINEELSRYPGADRNASMSSRHSNQTMRQGREASSASSSGSTLNGRAGVYNNAGAHSSSSINLPETVQEEFTLRRPEDPAEIERMFQNVVAALDFAATDNKKSISPHHRNSSSPTGMSTYQNVQSMSLDKKWMIIESDARSQWASTKRQAETPPNFYVDQMMNNKLTNHQLRDLEIMLRTSKVK
jgi:hypothetical protein